MTDHKATARSYSATASAATRRAEADAIRAEDAYLTSRRWQRQADQLTRAPALWGKDYNPAHLEDIARTWVRIGDMYLRSSFRETASAAHNRELAGKYRDMARRYDRPDFEPRSVYTAVPGI